MSILHQTDVSPPKHLNRQLLTILLIYLFYVFGFRSVQKRPLSKDLDSATSRSELKRGFVSTTADYLPTRTLYFTPTDGE